MIKGNKTTMIILAMVAVILIGVAAAFPNAVAVAAAEDHQAGSGGPGRPGGNTPASQNGKRAGVQSNLGSVCGTGNCVTLTSLSDVEKQGLRDAILEEYGALNLYNYAISKLGNVAPFSQIVRSEQQHVNALLRQAQKYGLATPTNPGMSSSPAITSLSQACQAGVKAETEDAALYDRLKKVTTHTDLLQVYNNLQNASLNNHLPAFQACD